MSAHILCAEGKHYRHDDLEFWAEDGLIFMEDHRDGSFNVIPCAEFKARAHAMMKEAARVEQYPSDAKHMRDWVIKMSEAYADARSQGDPMDPEVVKQRYKERRKAIMVTGMW